MRNLNSPNPYLNEESVAQVASNIIDEVKILGKILLKYCETLENTRFFLHLY